jgi:thioredoxin 1
MRKMATCFTTLILVLALWLPSIAAPQDEKIPRADMGTVVDLGARTCIPCKMMTPILEELAKEYEGRAAVIFVDVFQNPALSNQFKVSVMPTQIFFDKHGHEVSRHLGFMPKKDVVEQLDKLLKE